MSEHPSEKHKAPGHGVQTSERHGLTLPQTSPEFEPTAIRSDAKLAQDQGANRGQKSTALKGRARLKAEAEAKAPKGKMEVTSVEVVDGGIGYQNPPVITFKGGDGTGAVAKAVLDVKGTVTDICVTCGGRGYTSAPEVVITIAPTSTTPTSDKVTELKAATATATVELPEPKPACWDTHFFEIFRAVMANPKANITAPEDYFPVCETAADRLHEFLEARGVVETKNEQKAEKLKS